MQVLATTILSKMFGVEPMELHIKKMTLHELQFEIFMNLKDEEGLKRINELNNPEEFIQIHSTNTSTGFNITRWDLVIGGDVELTLNALLNKYFVKGV